MSNRSKTKDLRFWQRWRRGGSVATVTVDEVTRRRIIAEQVVEIPQCGLYVKTPEALTVLIQQLEADGYEIKDYRSPGEPKREHYRFMRLRDDVCELKGKCGSCGSYIDTYGIQCHKHRCEVCNAYTYVKYQDGTIVRFDWISRGESSDASGPSMKMKVFDYDDSLKCLLLYPDPEDGNDFNDWGIEKARKSLEKHQDMYTIVERDGRRFIAIPYDDYSGELTNESVISMVNIDGRRRNHRIVKLYKGKEYGEWDSLPLAESFNIYDAWPWAPLTPSLNLHEQIIQAAGMVSEANFYYQDGRAAFFDIHLERMRLFVQHFTTLNLEAWDRMIESTPKSGPGMIRAIAKFCHPSAVVRNEPNIFPLLNGVVKIGNALRGGHETFTADEIAGMVDALNDENAARVFSGLMSPPRGKAVNK